MVVAVVLVDDWQWWIKLNLPYYGWSHCHDNVGGCCHSCWWEQKFHSFWQKNLWLQIINVCTLSAEKRGMQVWQLCSWENGRLVWDDGERMLKDILSFSDHSSISIPRNTYNFVTISLFTLFFNNFFTFCSLCGIFPKERNKYMCIYLHHLGPMSIPGVDVILDSVSDVGCY